MNTTLRCFDDLTDLEKLALTDEEIERFVDIELMKAGLVRPKPPTLKEVVTPELPEGRTYWTVDGLLFDTPEHADTVLKLIVGKKEYCWKITGVSNIAKPFNGAIEGVSLLTEEDLSPFAAQLESAKAAKDYNETESKHYNEAIKGTQSAFEYIYDNLNTLRRRDNELNEIASTLDRYTELCGDRATAHKFILEKHSKSDVAEACTRYAPGDIENGLTDDPSDFDPFGTCDEAKP